MKTASLVAAHLTALGLLSSVARAQCPTTLTPSTHQPIQAPTFEFGYAAGSFYGRSGLHVPEPIPLGFQHVDTDTILGHCNEACYPIEVEDNVAANWLISQQSGSSGVGGAYIGADGGLTNDIKAVDYVLYLPPTDLAPGEFNYDLLNLGVLDLGTTGFVDSPVAQVIGVYTERDAITGLYNVSALNISRTTSTDPPLDCDGDPFPCEYSTAFFDGAAPVVAIVEHPTSGMTKGQVRMLKATASDVDVLAAECGTPPEFKPPDSQFEQIDVNDRLIFSWSVVPGVGTGDGVFIAEGRSSIFRATAQGVVKVRLDVTGVRGETEFTDITFEIFDPRLKQVSYKELATSAQLEVLRDSNGVPYDRGNLALPEWFDGNDDLDVVDANVDRRYPLCYVRDTKIVLSELVLIVNTPSPEGGTVKGLGALISNGTHTYWGGCLPDAVDPGKLRSIAELECDTALPNVIAAFPDLPSTPQGYAVDWTVDFGGNYPVYFGKSDNPVYVVKEPHVSGGLAFESVLNISCVAAQGATTEAGTFGSIWDHFDDLALVRKPFSGDMVTDGVALKYWPLSTPAPSSQVRDMLASAGGEGQCYAFTNLLRQCMVVQGFDTVSHEKLAHNYGKLFLVPSYTPTNILCNMQPGSNITDDPGVAAQGVSDPHSMFNLHVVVKWNGHYYDPSYGTDFATTTALESASIFALQRAVGSRYNQPGQCPASPAEEIVWTSGPAWQL